MATCMVQVSHKAGSWLQDAGCLRARKPAAPEVVAVHAMLACRRLDVSELLHAAQTAAFMQLWAASLGPLCTCLACTQACWETKTALSSRWRQVS